MFGFPEAPQTGSVVVVCVEVLGQKVKAFQGFFQTQSVCRRGASQQREVVLEERTRSPRSGANLEARLRPRVPPTFRTVARCSRLCSSARSSASEDGWLRSRPLSSDIWAPSWRAGAPCCWSPLASGGAAAGGIVRAGKSGKECVSQESWEEEEEEESCRR